MSTITHTSNRGIEFAAPLAACDDSRGWMKPKQAGYFRSYADPDGSVFLSFAPIDPAINPFATNLHLDMTIREAIELLGPDGLEALAWLCGGEV